MGHEIDNDSVNLSLSLSLYAASNRRKKKGKHVESFFKSLVQQSKTKNKQINNGSSRGVEEFNLQYYKHP